jgi:hypothetical protein
LLSPLPTNGRTAVVNGYGQQPHSSPHLYVVNNQVVTENPYPLATAEQLREVQEIARRLVQGEMVAGEVDMLSAHLRAPLADAVQHLLSAQAATTEKSDLWS